jgi:hypothetical protein
MPSIMSRVFNVKVSKSTKKGFAVRRRVTFPPRVARAGRGAPDRFLLEYARIHQARRGLDDKSKVYLRENVAFQDDLERYASNTLRNGS